MKYVNLRFFILLAFLALTNQIYSQNSEIGFSVTLSGHILMGPYYRYWIDDHNGLDLTVLAAYEDKLIFPHGFSAGYKHYFLDKKWRPGLGFQYTFMRAPVKDENTGKRSNLHLFSILPGVQYRWIDSKMNIEEFLWISYFKFNNKNRLLPIGLETRLGTKL